MPILKTYGIPTAHSNPTSPFPQLPYSEILYISYHIPLSSYILSCTIESEAGLVAAANFEPVLEPVAWLAVAFVELASSFASADHSAASAVTAARIPACRRASHCRDIFFDVRP